MISDKKSNDWNELLLINQIYSASIEKNEKLTYEQANNLVEFVSENKASEYSIIVSVGLNNIQSIGPKHPSSLGEGSLIGGLNL